MLPHDQEGAGPAVVLLHAGIADRSMWGDLLGPLSEGGHRVIAIDLPGFGEAEPRPGPQAAWNDVLDTLDELGLESAALVGSSYGGAIALRMAALHRGRFWGLVTCSAPAPGLEPSPDLAFRWHDEEVALDRGDFAAAARAVADGWTLPGAPAALRDGIETMQRRAFELQASLTDATETADPLADPDLLSQIDVPALIAYGEYDLVDFREGGKLLARLMPDTELHVFPNAGHLAPLETPPEFARRVLAFLDVHRPGNRRTGPRRRADRPG